MLKLISILGLALFLSCGETLQRFDYSEIENDSILHQYKTYLNDIQSFYGEATLNTSYVQNGNAETFDLSADIVWNPRDSFAIQTSATFLKLSAFDLFIGKHSFLAKMRDQYLRGLADDTFLQKLTKIQVPLKSWAKFFMGQVEIDSEGYESQLMNDGRKRFVYKDYEIYFRADVILPSEINFYDTNNELVQQYKTLGQFKIGEKVFPKTIILTNIKDQSEILVNYNKIEINRVLNKDLFEVKIPASLEQINYE